MRKRTRCLRKSPNGAQIRKMFAKKTRTMRQRTRGLR
jgi:hypothetical protein